VKATKDLITAGRAPVPFMVPALDAEVTIRRLRASEAEEVQAAEMAGLKAGSKMPRRGIRPTGHLAKGGVQRDEPEEITPDISLDLASIVTGTHRSNQLAMHYGLVDPAMSLAEVQGADAEVVEQIGEEVKRLSGIAETAAVRQFRGLTGGADGPSDPASGDTAGDDAG
jgi:hypothetical protein